MAVYSQNKRITKRSSLISHKGIFITFEGPEGSGKSTQAKLLLQYLESRNIPVILTREPGGTKIGQKIRQIILDPQNQSLSSKTELLLYAADRSQHVDEKIRPYLNKGYIVISDRYTDSTIAYQGFGRNLNLSLIKKLNDIATGSIIPDITIFLDIEIEKGLNQARRTAQDFHSHNGDRLEQEKNIFHKTVQKGYHYLYKKNKKRYIYILSDDTIESIHKKILNTLKNRIKI